MKNQLPIIPPDRIDDLQGLEYIEDAGLVVFMAGNQFMVMPDLINAFRRRYPEIERIFYETLPPGLNLNRFSKVVLSSETK